MRDIYINSQREAVYPSFKFQFNPDKLYPEYPWTGNDLSQEKNHVYKIVRDCLIGLKMDEKNINTKNWNPLGGLIREGDTVLIKPNWVMHFNKNKSVTENSLECLFTHPSVVRPVIDYCLIALKGSGKIIVGDSPMQGCDLDKLIKKSGYKELFDFYNHKSVDIRPTDFRQYSTIVDKNKVLTGKRYNQGEGIEVALDDTSQFGPEGGKKRKFRVSDYNEKITNKFHNSGKHSYLINTDVLSADVVINICKPKSHRLAGMTAAVKNFVGITYDKTCLPHRTIGAKQSGGDEYLHRSLVKKTIAWVLNKKIYFEEHNLFFLSLTMRYVYGALYYLMKVVSKDKYLMGSWYGNDTIWRTVLDLYRILLFADKKGIMKDKRQRKIFSFADMIISGERNGPVAPEPKKLGILIAGYDAVMIDRIICELMGFDHAKVPVVQNAVNDSKLISKEENDILIFSNLEEFDEKKINELHFPAEWRFKPYDAWRGYIEKK